MSIVHNTLDPLPKQRVVKIELVAAAGWRPSTQSEVVTPWQTEIDATTRQWQIDLPAQSTYAAPNSFYRVIEPGGKVWEFIVPDGAGPHWLHHLLVDPVPAGTLWTPVPNHSILPGLTGDHHPQYLTTERGDTRYAQSNDPRFSPNHGSLSGLTDDHHTQYLTASRADLRYPPRSRLIIPGTGVSGGGSLAEDVTIAVAYGTTAGTAAQGNDSRFSGPSTPTAHAASHTTTDPLSPTAIGAQASSERNQPGGYPGLDAGSKLTGSQQLYSSTATVAAVSTSAAGGSANSAARGDHVHTLAPGIVDNTAIAAAIKDPVAATPGLRTLGTGAQQAAAGNDARLFGPHTPTLHAASHSSSDPLTGYLLTANRGAIDGVAPLDGNARVPTVNSYAASPTQRGVVQLVNDLGGTSTAPTVPGLATKADTSYVDTLFGLPLAVGEEVINRRDVTGSVSLNSQSMRLTYFRARQTEVTTQVRMLSGATAAAATPTLIRIGLYICNSSGDGTSLVASIANDTSLFAAANTAYTRSWSASYGKVSVQLYALAVLVVSTVALPNLMGVSLHAAMATEGQTLPKVNGVLTSQTDLPASFLGSALVGTTGLPYGAIL